MVSVYLPTGTTQLTQKHTMQPNLSGLRQLLNITSSPKLLHLLFSGVKSSLGKSYNAQMIMSSVSQAALIVIVMV